MSPAERSKTMTYVTAKLAGQRKAREWSVRPGSDGRIFVQSDDSCGAFWPQTGEGKLDLTSPYHFAAFGKPFKFPEAFVAACMAACPEPGGYTSLGGGVVIARNSVQVI